jgi:hypothetical protein
MPCTCRDRRDACGFLTYADLERLEVTLTDRELDRIRALRTPWPKKPFVYFDWLCRAMDEEGKPGTALFLCAVLTGMVAITALCLLTIWLCTVGWGWFPCLLGGLGLGTGCRSLLHGARATELRYRNSIAEKLPKDYKE